MQCSVSAGNAAEDQAPAEAVLRKPALRFSGTVESRDDLSSRVYDLRRDVCPQACE